MAALSALATWILAGVFWTVIGWPGGMALIGAGVMSSSAGAWLWIVATRSGGDERRLQNMQKALEGEVKQLEEQRKTFERRLMTYQEWLEFPSPETAEISGSVNEAIAQDEEVQRIVEDASTRVLEGLQGDRYTEDGTFEPKLLVPELLDVVSNIAAIYRPDSDRPFLETSVEKFLKSINQVSLQLLSHLEALPFNLKDYSLSKAYEYVRKANRVHGYYRALTPYLPYASYTWQVGRLVLGSNPLVAGAMMLGTEVMKRTGRKVSRHYVEKYSLQLIASTVRLVANQAAMAYDPHYRYRDANWIYGVELTELVRSFPASRDTLKNALSEIGHLPFRNSYDRVFLYRCAVEGKSPRPEIFSDSRFLSNRQRLEIVERLERFFRRHIHGRQPDRVAEWSSQASQRLGVAIQAESGRSRSEARGRENALISLGSFLIALKQWEPGDVKNALFETEVAQGLPDEFMNELIAKLESEPPMFFDFPDLDPEEKIVPTFLSDLVKLETLEKPADHLGYLAIRESAEYFRRKWAEFEPRLLDGYRKCYEIDLDPDAPRKGLTDDAILALPLILDVGERAEFVYPRVSMDSAGSKNSKYSRFLIGTLEKLVLVEVRSDLDPSNFDRNAILWSFSRAQDAEKPRFESRRGLNSALEVSGGTWKDAEVKNQTFSVPCERLKASSAYFGPLIRWIEGLD